MRSATDYSQPPGNGSVDDPDGDEPASGAERLLEAQREDAGERLDRFVARRLSDVSRSRVQQWIELGSVDVDGVARPSKYRLGGHENVAVRPLPRAADTAFAPDPVPLAIVHEDASLIVVDKPPGLVTHPAAGHWRGTLMNGLLHHRPAQAGLPRAGIVHRLDKDTSGLLVVARTERAVARLVEQLADRTMSRRYLALVEGEPPASGTVDAAIGRDPSSPVRMAVVDAARGRHAVTRFETLARGRRPGGGAVALVRCALETGRTHQIRVHLRHIGHPLVGDAVYGRRDASPPIARQALHAWRLGLRHPDTGAPVAWVAPPPADFVAALRIVGIDPDVATRSP